MLKICFTHNQGVWGQIGLCYIWYSKKVITLQEAIQPSTTEETGGHLLQQESNINLIYLWLQ